MRTQRLFPLLALLLAVALASANGLPESPPEHPRHSAKVRNVLAELDAERQAAARIPFGDDERENWHFIPRERRGLPLRQMEPAQRERVLELLRAALSEDGFQKQERIRLLDQVLFDATGSAIRDPNLYYLTVFGTPGEGLWGWRFEGHHISMNFTLRGEELVSATPFFYGANPAEVREGPHQGLRTLAEEEEQGRALYGTFPPAMHSRVRISAEAPADIITGSSRRAELGPPAGVPLAEMSVEQAERLMTLVRLYLGRLHPAHAERELERLRRADLQRIHFAWAGAAEPGRPHYYRIQGPTFVIEYDNTQNNANHIHTVWRDFQRDFGRDLLAEHYRRSPHHRHAHAAGR
jgi:hypothetical protein